MSLNRAFKQDPLSVKGNNLQPFSFPTSGPGLTDNYSTYDREKEYLRNTLEASSEYGACSQFGTM
jgi:hypothetical protein